MSGKIWFICNISWVLAMVCDCYWHVEMDSKNWTCWEDFQLEETHCGPLCPNGTFSLPGMDQCHPWLTCGDSVSAKELIVTSVVKTVYLGDWKGHQVVLSHLSSLQYEEDFQENLNLLQGFGPNLQTVNFLGYCNHTIFTQYYKLGSALNLQVHLDSALAKYNSTYYRLRLCYKYASILSFLHSNVLGTRVMCDSSTLGKTLSQYLLTDDLELVLNDMDALPRVDVINGGVRCGHRQLFGDFVAPEQLWTYNGDFVPEKMQPYDEKTDIWKIPDVCNWFLGDSVEADIAKFKLFKVHQMCKAMEPKQRPSAQFVYESYLTVWNNIFQNDTDMC